MQFEFCQACLIRPTLEVTIKVGDTTIFERSCFIHPLEIGRRAIKRENLDKVADEKGYSISYEPL